MLIRSGRCARARAGPCVGVASPLTSHVVRIAPMLPSVPHQSMHQFSFALRLWLTPWRRLPMCRVCWRRARSAQCEAQRSWPVNCSRAAMCWQWLGCATILVEFECRWGMAGFGVHRRHRFHPAKVVSLESTHQISAFTLRFSMCSALDDAVQLQYFFFAKGS
jgi:hypothetical protein